jgi:hypothetical protein
LAGPALNSIILLGLIVMWAVVLIPMWLRRHDETEEARSVDRFTSAMHTLSRRDPDAAADKRYVVMPNRYSSHDVHVSGASDELEERESLWGRVAHHLPTLPISTWRASEGTSATDDHTDDHVESTGPLTPRHAIRSTGSPRPPAPPRRPKTAAERRRRTLMGLAALALVSLIAAIFVGGMIAWTVQILTDLALVGFVVHLRRRAQAAAAAARRARRRPTPYVEPQRDIDPAYVAPRVSYRARPAAPAAARPVEAEPLRAPVEWVAEPAPERAPAAATASALVFDEPFEDTTLDAADSEQIGARPWEPVPVPRPVYTTKPVAPPRRRVAPSTEPLLPPVETAAELDPVDDLEEILDRRWAVND